MARKPVSKVADIAYVPTPREKAAIERTLKRKEKRPTFPPFKFANTDGKGTAKVAIEHENEDVAVALQLDALGLSSNSELTSVMKSVFNFTTRDGQVDADAATEAHRLVVGLGPQNTTEALLATQMVTVHLAAMAAARRLNNTPGNYESIACHSKALNNLTRTFAVQAEAMKKLKGGGQQKVVVEHKHYYLAPGAIANSNAVLGDVSQGRGTNEIGHQPHEHEAGVSERSTVHGHLEANEVPLSGAGSEWLEGLPLPWSQERSPERVS